MVDYDTFLSATGRQLQDSAIRRMGTVIGRAPDMVSFAAGYPDPTLFPWEELQAIAGDLLGRREDASLQYLPTRGYDPLIETLTGVLEARGVRVPADQMLVTSGSQQGIDLTARLFVAPGDVVLVELPTFTGAIAAFRNMQARLAGVAQDEQGLDLDALDAIWRRETRAGRRVKLLYLIPNFQNPTGRLLAADRRGRLLEWAGRRNVLVIEDDPYGSLYFDEAIGSAGTRPLRADDTEGRVIYLSTVSKTLAPGFRVGWMVAPAALIDRFETAKQSQDLMTGSLDQRICERALHSGLIDALAPRLRAHYRHKRDVMAQALRDTLGDRLAWSDPQGGFFFWARLPAGCTDAALLERALAERAIFVAGSAFHVDGTGHDTIRLSFSAPPVERLREGVERLARAWPG
jgi:2-aminoadipate transaminase